MFEKLDHCPLCNSGHFSNYMICKDFTVSHEDFALVRCDSCDFLFTNPRPAGDKLKDYYQSEDYISHSNKSNNPINFAYKIARHFTIKSKVKLANAQGQKGKLLDIGCGTGHFLSACKQENWNISGVEPDPGARALARQNTQVEIVDNISRITQSGFNVITLWHVLEHIPDLNDFIKRLGTLLAQDGTIIVAVPNYKSYDARHYKEYWAAYDVPRHLYHFEQATMKALMKNHGLKIKQVLPMKLDAYYVSLLSETYQGKGLSKYPNSAIIGYKSNVYAKKHNNNYSSLIYIIRK